MARCIISSSILWTFICLIGISTLNPLLAKEVEKQIEQLENRLSTVEKSNVNNHKEFKQAEARHQTTHQTINDKVEDLRGYYLEQSDSLEALRKHTQGLASFTHSMQDSVQSNHAAIQTVFGMTGLTTNYLDRFWILICAILVFFMQAGFKVLEVGMVRKEHRAGIGMKNLMDWLIVCGAFYLVGFSFMFGPSDNAWLGWDLFTPDSGEMGALNPKYKLEFFLFQLAFAGTATTIVSGAMSERSALTTYLFTAIVMGAMIYPLFGYWAWGNLFIDGNEQMQIPANTPWLAQKGFHDFAGSTVVHSIGAWVALAGIFVIGPRRGRFDPAKAEKFKPSDLGYSVLGVFILWFGWWGFNGGSNLTYNDEVSSIILNTNLSAAFAGLSAFIHALSTDKEQIYPKLIGGVLGGLVAITACCDIVSPEFAILIGLSAGIIHNLSFDLLLKWKLDDPVGAIPVHGFCGAWGTLCVGLFGIGEQLPTGNRGDQIMVQLLGILVAFVFAAGVAFLLFKLLERLVGLRVSAEDEEHGITLVGSRETQV